MSNQKTPAGVSIANQGDSQCWKLDKVINGQRFTGTSKRYRGDYLSHQDWWKSNEEWYAHTLERIRREKDYGESHKTFLEGTEVYLKHKGASLRDVKEMVRLLSVANSYLGQVLLEDVHRYHSGVEQLVSDLKDKGRKNKTINNHLLSISAVLHFCTQQRNEGGRPWLVSAPKLQLLSLEDSRLPKVITWKESQLLLNSLPEHLSVCSRFILLTGLRDSELTSLQWRDIRKDLSVPFALVTRVKNQQQMPVVLNSQAQKMLDSLWNSSSKNENSRVFLWRNSPISRINNTAWKKHVQGKSTQKTPGGYRQVNYEKGLGWDLRVHDLRHTYGHRLLEAGCPEEIRRTMLGHKSQTVTQHYSQASLETMLEYSEKASTPNDRTPVLRVV
jgi:integrase